MDIITLFTIIGLPIALVGLYYTRKAYAQQKRFRIHFVPQSKVNLYDDIVKSIDGISINYNGNAVTGRMYYLRGVLLCSGKREVTRSDIERGIIIKMKSSNARWHSCKVVKSTPYADFNSALENEEFEIIPLQIKHGDYFVIEGLVEADDPDLRFDHRITNVEKITVGLQPGQYDYKSNLWVGLLSLGLAIFMLLMLHPFRHVSEYDLSNNLKYNRLKELENNSHSNFDSAQHLFVALSLVNTQRLQALKETSDSLSKERTANLSRQADSLLNEFRTVSKHTGDVSNYDSVIQDVEKRYLRIQLFFGHSKSYRLSDGKVVQFWIAEYDYGSIIFCLLSLLFGIVWLQLAYRYYSDRQKVRKILAESSLEQNEVNQPNN